jgi:hypothetical protein
VNRFQRHLGRNPAACQQHFVFGVLLFQQHAANHLVDGVMPSDIFILGHDPIESDGYQGSAVDAPCSFIFPRLGKGFFHEGLHPSESDAWAFSQPVLPAGELKIGYFSPRAGRCPDPPLFFPLSISFRSEINIDFSLTFTRIHRSNLVDRFDEPLII